MRASILAAMQIVNRKIHHIPAMTGADVVVTPNFGLNDYHQLGSRLAKENGSNLVSVVLARNGAGKSVMAHDSLEALNDFFGAFSTKNPSIEQGPTYLAVYVLDNGLLKNEDFEKNNPRHLELDKWLAAFPEKGEPLNEVLLLPKANTSAVSTANLGTTTTVTKSDSEGINPLIAVLGFGGSFLALVASSKR